MGFWNKLGKIALTAAPYIAAPFTGGLSLAATGAANKAVQKWSEKDAQKNMAKGLAPSKFDAALNKVGGISSMASMFMPTGAIGAFGKAASTAAKTGSALANVQKAASVASPFIGGSYTGPKGVAPSTNTQDKMVNQKTGQLPVNARSSNQIAFGSGSGNSSMDKFNAAIARGTQGRTTSSSTQASTTEDKKGIPGWQKALGIAIPAVGGLVASGAFSKMGGGDTEQGMPIRPPITPQQGRIPNSRGLGPAMNMMDQSNPNLALSIAQGRQEAMRNQPWRSGYDVTYPGDVNEETGEETTITSKIPPIYPNAGGRNRGNGGMRNNYPNQNQNQSRRARAR